MLILFQVMLLILDASTTRVVPVTTLKTTELIFKLTGNINSTSNNNNPLNFNYKSGNNNINENNRFISRIKNIANNPVKSDAFKFNTKDSNSFNMSTKKSGNWICRKQCKCQCH